MIKIFTACLILVVYVLPTPSLAQSSFGSDYNWSPLFEAPSPVLYPRSIQTSESHLFVSGNLIPPDSLDIVNGTLYRSLEDTEVRYFDIEGWESATLVVGENRIFAWKGEYTGELAEIDLEAGTAETLRSPRGIHPQFKIFNEELYALSFSDSVRVLRLDEAEVEWESLGAAVPELRGSIYDWMVGEGGVYVVHGQSALCEVTQCENTLWNLNERTWTKLADVKSPALPGVTRIAQDNNNRLIIIGAFSEVNGVQANWVARWDGNQWVALDEGIPDDVEQLADIVTRGDQLYMSSFEGHVLEWNGLGWDNLGNQADQGVFHLEARGGRVYTVGKFTVIDEAITHKVAAWDIEERAWDSVFPIAGEGVEGQIRALAVTPDGALYAGGILDVAGNTLVQNIARWDGTGWRPVGDGLEAVVDVLMEKDELLYAGTQDGVAMYDPARDTWTYLQNQTEGIQLVSVSDMVMFQNEVYVKGQDGETFERGFFRWNGNAWDAFGDFRIDGQRGGAGRLATDGEDVLYVSGFFDQVDGVEAQNLAAWDGTNWSSLENDTISETTALAVSNGLLYVGTKTYTDVGSSDSLLVWNPAIKTWAAIPFPDQEYASCDRQVNVLLPRTDGLYAGLGLLCAVPVKKAPEWSPFLRWDGTRWEVPGSGISNGSVVALVDNGADIYAGGSFSAAGGRSSLNVAHWNESIRLTSIEKPESATLAGLHQNYPNPFTDQTTISFTLEDPVINLQLEVYDLLGRKVKQLYTGAAQSGTHQVQLDATGLAAGIYIYRLKKDDQVFSRKMTVLR